MADGIRCESNFPVFFIQRVTSRMAIVSNGGENYVYWKDLQCVLL